MGGATALVNLRVAGEEVPLVQREEGRIWLKGLGGTTAPEEGPEQIELQVHRRISDGVPVLVETRLVFQVAGRARELLLERPLLPRTVPLSVDGDLALAMEEDGALRVQLTPGNHSVTITARFLGNPRELNVPEHGPPWPKREIWVWQPASKLRAVETSGLPGIDPSRTELPKSWRKQSAYVAEPGDALQLRTTRRGQAEIPPNRLSLSRELWLDQDADEWTVRDRMSGVMNRDWRLDLLRGRLGEVKVDQQPQVITRGPQGHEGVEVRDAALQMEAVSRLKRRAQLPAVAWSEDVESLSARLHLPPGWDVFAASGVDTMANTWLARWNLFGVFYVLVLTLATAQLCGRGAGVVAFVALVSSHGISDAPEFVWLPLIVLLALMKLSRGSWFRLFRGAFVAIGVVLCVFIVVFSVDQVRHALFPHVDSFLPSPPSFTLHADEEARVQAPTDRLAEESAGVEEDGVQAEARPVPDRPAVKSKRLLSRQSGSSAPQKRSGDLQRSYGAQKQLPPDAIVPTGPGVPQSGARSWTLGWSGPVAHDHELRLYLISPTVMRLWTVVRVAAVVALAWLLFRAAWNVPGGAGGAGFRLPRSPGRRNRRRRSEPSSGSSAALRVFSLLVAVAVSWGVAVPAAQAQQPSQQRLEQLREHLTEPPACAPNCLSVSRLHVEAADAVEFRAEVHAESVSAYKLPGQLGAMAQLTVRLDGAPASALRLGPDGAYYLRVPPGVHEVVVRGIINGNRVTLDGGTKPRRVEVETDGWIVTGVTDQGLATAGTLTFARKDREGQSPESSTTVERVAVPPFFRVRRRLSLSIRGQVETTIERLSEPSQPEVLPLPLLSGERVTTPGISSEQGVAKVSFAREETTKTLVSTLSLPPEGEPLRLELRAPKRGPFTPTWEIECGLVWHCLSEGLAPVSHVGDGRALKTYTPWPGETLTVEATQPQPVEGQSVTIEGATLTLTPGVRMSQGKLQMALRTSRSLVHVVTVPSQARLERVMVDGVSQPVKSEDGKVRLSVNPGEHHVLLEWQSKDGLQTMFRTPRVSTGAPGVNYRIVVELPAERWLLLAAGPERGPAILFWGYLALIVIAALLLPRLPYNPLTSRQWLLLGLGLTQIPAAVGVFVVGWFFLIGSRPRWRLQRRWLRNGAQLALVGYTLLFVIALTTAVYSGLVSSPDMEVEGSGSHNGYLVWYLDRSAGTFPQAWVLSLTVWVWRALMMAWALWLARSLLHWFRWAWENASVGGFWISKGSASAPPSGTGTASATENAQEQPTKERQESRAEEPEGENSEEESSSQREGN